MFDVAPRPYGTLHLAFIIAIACMCIIAGRLSTRHDRDLVEKWIGATGVFMLAAEIAKQIFCYVVVGGTYPIYEIPLELCSTSMYVAAALPFVSEKGKAACLAYLPTFGTVGAIAALMFPFGMMGDYIFLTLHSFVYHGLMLVVAVLAASSFVRIDYKSGVFKNALVICLCFAAAAEMVNVCLYLASNGALRPNLFYISPWVECEQPVFSTISQTFGHAFEIAFYLAVIIAVAAVFYAVLIVFRKEMNFGHEESPEDRL